MKKKKNKLALVFVIIPGMQVTAAVRTITVVVDPVVHTEAYQGHTSAFFSLLFQISYLLFQIWNLLFKISNLLFQTSNLL